MIEANGLTGIVNKSLIQYRVHPSSITSVYRKEQTINAIVARYAYKLRQLSIPDGQDERIDINYFQANIPDDLKSTFATFMADYFLASHVDISTKGLDAINQCLQEFAKIKHAMNKTNKKIYYIRIAIGYFRNSNYGKCIYYSLLTCKTGIRGTLVSAKEIFERRLYRKLFPKNG